MHLDGQLRRAIQARQVDETPARELRAIAQVGIFGESVMLPAAGVFYSAPPKDACGAVEIEKITGPGSRSVLENEMAVEQHRLHFGQEVVVAIEVTPASLHHADGRVGKEMDRAREEIGWRNEIGIEDRDQLTSSRFESRLQRPRLESVTIGPVMILDREPQRPIALHQRFGEQMRVVGRIVQHLNLQQVLRVFDLGDLVDQPLHDIPLVVQGKLDGDDWRGVERLLVLGLGSMGLLFAQLLPHYTSAAAAGAGRRAARVELARRFGLDPVWDVEHEPVPGGERFDCVIECTGRLEGWQQAFAHTAPGGQTLLFGGIPRDVAFPVDSYRLHYEEVRVLGSFHLLESLQKAALDPTVVVVGSSSVYGSRTEADMPLDEDTSFKPTSMSSSLRRFKPDSVQSACRRAWAVWPRLTILRSAGTAA